MIILTSFIDIFGYWCISKKHFLHGNINKMIKINYNSYIINYSFRCLVVWSTWRWNCPSTTNLNPKLFKTLFLEDWSIVFEHNLREANSLEQWGNLIWFDYLEYTSNQLYYIIAPLDFLTFSPKRGCCVKAS